MKHLQFISRIGLVFGLFLFISCQTTEPIEAPSLEGQSKEKITPFKTNKTDNSKLIFAYIGPKSVAQFTAIKNYRLKNGKPAINMVSIFAANLVLKYPPYLKAQNNPNSEYSFNDNIREVLANNAAAIKEVQAGGTKVLITILGAHHNAGWACFGSEKEAQKFVDFLKDEVIDKYGLDGIDIDDEFSACDQIFDNSLAMVATLFKKTMPNKLLTKALYRDKNYFNAKWEGNTLGQHLDFGAEMSYFSTAFHRRLNPYLHYMDKSKLLIGFSAEDRFAGDRAAFSSNANEIVYKDGFRGAMLFNFENQPAGINSIRAIVDGIHGPGNWIDFNSNQNMN